MGQEGGRPRLSAAVVVAVAAIAAAGYFYCNGADSQIPPVADLQQPSPFELPQFAVAAGEDAVVKGTGRCDTNSDMHRHADSLLTVLDRLVKLPQFRFFRARLDNECPYWAAHVLCMSADNPCQVCTCDEHDVPNSLLPHIAHEPLPRSNDDDDCSCADASANLGRVEDGVVVPEHNIGDIGGDEVLVDLVMNPESNTFYLGELANKVWDAIYSENCVQLYDTADTGTNRRRDDDACAQLHLVHRLISGLHTSISSHISAHYFKRKCSEGIDHIRNVTFPIFDPNEVEFHRRVLDHRDRIDNLLFLHRFVLRACVKVAPLLSTSECVSPNGGRFYSANETLDDELCETLHTLLGGADSLLCDATSAMGTFDEDEFLSSESGKRFFVPQVERTLSNITSLMDCLTCEKCRLWGKLQLTGLNAAVRIVFAAGRDGAHSPPHALTAREEVALVNLLRQLTLSVKEVTARLL